MRYGFSLWGLGTGNAYPQYRIRNRFGKFAVFLRIKMNPVGGAAFYVLAGIKKSRTAFPGKLPVQR